MYIWDIFIVLYHPHGVSYRCAFLYLFMAFDRLHYDRQSFVLPPMYVLAVIEEIATTHSMEYSGGSRGLHWFPRKPPFKSDKLFAY